MNSSHAVLNSLRYKVLDVLCLLLQFSMIMQYDYKHTATALVRGSQESEEQIVTLKHKMHINLGPVQSEA